MAASLLKRRIPPMSLNIDDSGESTPDNRYLSPTLSPFSELSPPPRPQADDYFGSKRGKKRRQSRIKRPCPTPIFRSEDTGSGEASLGQSTRLESSKGYNLEPSYDHRDDAALLKETAWSDPPLSASVATGGQDGTGLWAEQSGDGSTASYRPTVVCDSPSNQDDSYDLDDSPAVNSLRRISRSMTQSSDSKRREFKYLSKALTDKINSVFRSKEKSPFGEFNDNTDRGNIFGFHRACTDPSTFRENASGNLSPISKASNAQAARLRNPAIITLRKASSVNTLGGTAIADRPPNSDGKIIQNNQQQISSIPSPDLGSFQNRPKYRTPKFAWPNDRKLVKWSTPPVSGSSYDEKPYVRVRLMSLCRLGKSTQSQQYAIPAEPALTVTSFHPTRAASSKPQSRSHSVSLERAPSRFSIVQIVSRNSVHEVIWYEDDTSGSDASPSPTSPTIDLQASGGSVPKVFVDSGEQAPLIAITTPPTEVSASPQANGHGSTDSFIDPNDAREKLLSWSWDHPRPSVAGFSSSSQEGNEGSEHRERTLSVSMRSSFSMRRAATTDGLAAGYSPHPTEQDFLRVDGDTDEESIPTIRTKKIKERDMPGQFDRGMDMFQRRGVSLGSVPGTRTGSQSIGERKGVQSACSQLRENTK